MGGMQQQSDSMGSRGLAELSGRSQRTVRRWMAKGFLPCLPAPPGAHRRVSLATLRKRLKDLEAARQADQVDDQADQPD